LLIPLRTRGEIIGTISLSTNQDGRVFSQDEVRLAETIATQIAVAVDNARLFDQEQQRAIEMAELYEEAEAARTAVEQSAHAVELANQALAENILELQYRNAELDAFAHTVAHDLKNPLGVLIGYTEWLIYKFADLPQEEAKQYLSIVMEKGRKIKDITDSLLLLATTRREDVDIIPLPMDIIMTEVQSRVSTDAEQKQAQIIWPESWPMALGYAPWVEEVWVNYVGNALKYGGDPPIIALGADMTAQGKIRYWVKDNGAGLTEEQQEKLFTPFTRLHVGRADGHGLGLSIVQRIIEQLGGEVGVESVFGEGSTFFFTLPAAVHTE
jgi:signal transduction histidine kinase